ncbi:MAG: PQQ-binding-like beta-propeller repeat protein [Rhodospirillales bacterium]|nr:PQQ-binding-like beta-propeller repeat protein [Rhodospirillales bacterium]
MVGRRRQALLAVLVVGGSCLVLGAAGARAAGSGQPVKGERVVGAEEAPPVGPGPGRVFIVDPATGAVQVARFGKPGTLSGNSFRIGYDRARDALYVPSEAGRMTVLNGATLKPEAVFPIIGGARLALVVARRHLVLVLSGQDLAAYDLATHRPLFTLPVGGNAIAVSARGSRVFVGGNMDRSVTEVSLPGGRRVASYPIARSGDLLMADGHLFSADIKSGVLSMLEPRTGKIVTVRTNEVDPHFSYKRIGAAVAGFMQLAAARSGGIVYVAGFSGHILKFSAATGHSLGEVAVDAGPGANKLSGLAVLAGGREGVVTIESRGEAAVVDLRNGKILRLLKDVTSNRWVVALPVAPRHAA